MKGDFTRSTFNPKKHYSSVRMQQGRVQLDADWNEQVDILAHLNQTQIRDLVGLSGVPKSENNEQSFKIIETTEDENDKADFKIAPGCIYVDGILCELEKETTYQSQPDYPNALQEDLKNALQKDLDSKGNYIVYLDVWQRHITSVDDPEIREVALVNVPDTATRTKTIWQVKLLHVPQNDDVQKTWEQFRKEQNRSNIALTPSVPKTANLENHLYRIEIHEGGKAEDATFKWSRDNGFVVSTIQEIKDNIITIVQNNDDAWQLSRPRQWVEILRNDKEENWELCGKPGILARLMRVSGNRLIIDRSSIKNSGKLNLPKKYPIQENPEQQYKVRLWDYTIDTGEKEGITINSGNNSGFILLEGEEISVKFDKFDKNEPEYNYQTGDYWLIPTRRNSQNPLEWSLLDKKSEGNNSYVYLPLPPDRIKHHYSCLALIKFNGKDFKLQDDYRKPFPSLINCLDKTDNLNLGGLQFRGQLSKAQGTISSEKNLVTGEDTTFTKELEGFAIIAEGQIGTVEKVINSYKLRVTKAFDPELIEGTSFAILPQGRGELTSNSNNEISYIGDGLAELAVGYSIWVQDEIRTIQYINQNTQIIGVDKPFDSPFQAARFSYQQPLLMFSDSSGATQLIFDTWPQNQSDTRLSLVVADSQANTQLVAITSEGKFVIGQDPSTDQVTLDIKGIVDAKDFYQNGSFWELDTKNLKNDAVTAEKLRDETDDANNQLRAVTTNHIRNDAITTPKLADDAVTAEQLQDHPSDNQLRAVDTNHIRNGAVTAEKLADSVIPNLRKWSDGDNESIYYNNGNVALGTDQATASLQVQGSEPETASGTISGRDLVTVTGNEETEFNNDQKGSLLITANEIRVITEVRPPTEVTVDLPFSKSLLGENFAVVPVQDVTISPSSTNQKRIKINGDIPSELRKDKIIIAAGQIRTVLTANRSSNEFTIDSPFKDPLQVSTPFAILQPAANEEANITVSGWDEQTQSWNRAIARVEGEIPSNLVATGDFIIAEGQLRKVETIDDTNSSFIVTPPFREPLPSETNLFILPQESGTITTEITVAVNTNAAVNQLHIGDLISATGQTRLITQISAQNKLTLDAPFDSSLTNAAFSFQQPIARFVDSNQKTQLIINAEGNVGIGTSIPTAKLQVDGPVRINDDLWCKGTLLQSSSLTLKTNIVELSRQEANQILRELNPIKFHYKEDRFNHPHIGFIAEDTPDLVASNDKKAICPVDIVAVLTKTVQYHEQTISQLTNLVDEQKNEIAILQENFTRLSEILQKKERSKKQRRLTIRAIWRQLKRLYSKTFRLVVLDRDRD